MRIHALFVATITWAVLMNSASAQTARDLVEAKASLARSGDEASVRDLTVSVFEPFSWARSSGIRDQVSDRITSAELSFRAGTHAGIRLEDVVQGINHLAERIGAPSYAKTSLQQVRYLRLSLMMESPHLIAAEQRNSGEKDLPATMSPIEAVYLTLSLIHQKLNNPRYQEDDNGDLWVQRRESEALLRAGIQSKLNKPVLLSVHNPRKDEMRQAAMKTLSLPDAEILPDTVLDELGVSR